MKTVHHNFHGRTRWRRWTGLLPVALVPLALVGFSLRPALEYAALSDDLTDARSRALESDDLGAFLASFGGDGPPTDEYRALLELVAERLPRGFQPTDFLERAVAAARGIDVTLGAIDPGTDTDLDLPVGDLTVHERSVTVQGRGALDDLGRFLSALHRAGQPVGVRQAKLDALETGHQFDFQLELSVYHLSPPKSDLEIEDDLAADL